MQFVQMRNEGSGYEAEGDDSPDTKTLIFIKQEFVCRNPQCANYGRVVETAKTQLN